MRFERAPWWSAVVFAVLAFLHAALWGSIVPPWQIPDEAAHFEYVHLLTRLGRRPTPADADPELQAAILRSMWENRYWEYLGFRRPEQPPRRILAGAWTAGGALPDDGVVGDAYIYAFSQLQNPTPAYYALLAPVQRLVMDQPVTDQLLALRWASRVIFALGVMFIVLTAGEVFAWRAGPVLGAGLFSVLQPMFVYIGSGLNNDNGVMLFASAAAWQLARGWRRGYSWRRLLLIAALVALAVQAKRTSVFLAAWAPLVIGAWWWRRQSPLLRRRLALVGGAGILGLGALAAALYFAPGPTPANWRSADPWRASWESTDAVHGARAFRVQGGPSGPTWVRTSFRRPLGLGDGLPFVVQAQHRGGAAALAVSDDAGNMVTSTLASSPAWQPARVEATLDPRATRITVWLRAQEETPAWFDALQATLSSDPPRPLPLPNPSAEAALPLLGQVALSIAEPLGAYGQAVRVVQDYRANLAALGQRLPQAIAFVQQSYWGKFGIFARRPNPTLDMGWVTLLAMLFGGALALTLSDVVRRRPDADTAALLGLALAGLALLLAQTFAPLLSFSAEGTWLPQGRYLFAGMGLIAAAFAAPFASPAWASLASLVYSLLDFWALWQTAAFFG
ncbi:MAG: hypothetical protein ACK4JD_09825 [Thermoflexales bacterium]